jgi:hypothetical protein
MVGLLAASHVREVKITIDQLDRALEREAAFKRDLREQGKAHCKDSIRSGAGDFIGLLGEEIIYSLYAGLFDWSAGSRRYDWDLRLQQTARGRIDVKTKAQTYPKAPAPHYFATVCDKNTTQDCDWYCFVRVHELCETAWVLGLMPKAQFFRTAQKYLKGEIDPTSHCDWRFKEDCWNLPVKDLISPPADVHELRRLFMEYETNADH